MSLVNNESASNYHALQILDQGYVAPGLQLLTSFTWAHARDSASSDTFTSLPSPLWGNSDNDVRLTFNTAINYNIPGAKRAGFWGHLSNGWLGAARLTAQTGYPLNIVQGYSFLPDGQQQQVSPDLVPNVPIYLHGVSGAPGGWQLNPAAFNLVPTDANGNPARQGTLGRNFLHGPGFFSLNTAIQRRFALSENLGLLFRVEAFNLLNHPNFNNIDTYLPDATFGEAREQATIGTPNQLYGNGAPRSLQLSLKLQF